jgi:hypothetical protein
MPAWENDAAGRRKTKMNRNILVFMVLGFIYSQN